MRVETERRLKSLQKDLGKAETGNKERALAMRYHKVKFFGQSVSNPVTHGYLSSGITDTERQKLLRKINQVKKQLPVDEDRLFALRVDLNYVLVRGGQRCSAGTRTLTFFSALSETTEICSAISTEDRWGSRVNRDGCSSGGGADAYPGTDGERGDLAYAGGGAGWEWERVMLGRRYIGRVEERASAYVRLVT